MRSSDSTPHPQSVSCTTSAKSTSATQCSRNKIGLWRRSPHWLAIRTLRVAMCHLFAKMTTGGRRARIELSLTRLGNIGIKANKTGQWTTLWVGRRSPVLSNKVSRVARGWISRDRSQTWLRRSLSRRRSKFTIRSCRSSRHTARPVVAISLRKVPLA